MTDAFKLAQENLRTATEFHQLFRHVVDPTLTSTECVRLVHGDRESAAFIIDGPDHGVIAGYVAHFINELFNTLTTGAMAAPEQPPPASESSDPEPSPLVLPEKPRLIGV
jgi:hypothetical protein